MVIEFLMQIGVFFWINCKKKKRSFQLLQVKALILTPENVKNQKKKNPKKGGIIIYEV